MCGRAQGPRSRQVRRPCRPAGEEAGAAPATAVTARRARRPRRQRALLPRRPSSQRGRASLPANAASRPCPRRREPAASPTRSGGETQRARTVPRECATMTPPTWIHSPPAPMPTRSTRCLQCGSFGCASLPMPREASVRAMEASPSVSDPASARIASMVSGMTIAWLSTM